MGTSTKYFVSVSTFFPVASDSFNSVIFLAFISFSFLDPSEQASDSLVMANDGKSQLMYMNMCWTAYLACTLKTCTSR